MAKKESKEVENKRLSLDEVVAAVTKQFGKGTVFTTGGQGFEPLPATPTGSPSLNRAIGVGGVPKGRIIEVFGPESSGKTTLACDIIAHAQMEGGIAAFIDAEHALDLRHAEELGVDVTTLLLSQPECAEDTMNLVQFYLENKLVDIIVVDSVAALIPKAELEGEAGNSVIGLQARLMSQMMRKIKGLASSHNTTIVFINQTRQKIGVLYGNPETTTGGNALKFYASVRIRVSKGKPIVNNKDTIGTVVKFKVVKNKVAAPFKEAEAYLYFKWGFDAVHEEISQWVHADIVEKSGAWYSYKGEQLGNGLLAVSKYLREERPDILQSIQKDFSMVAGDYIVDGAPEPEEDIDAEYSE